MVGSSFGVNVMCWNWRVLCLFLIFTRTGSDAFCRRQDGWWAKVKPPSISAPRQDPQGCYRRFCRCFPVTAWPSSFQLIFKFSQSSTPGQAAVSCHYHHAAPLAIWSIRKPIFGSVWWKTRILGNIPLALRRPRPLLAAFFTPAFLYVAHQLGYVSLIDVNI